jgi:hypothetical protein
MKFRDATGGGLTIKMPMQRNLWIRLRAKVRGKVSFRSGARALPICECSYLLLLRGVYLLNAQVADLDLCFFADWQRLTALFEANRHNCHRQWIGWC